MANEKDPTPGTRGWRVDQLRRELNVKRKDLAPMLADIAADLHLRGGEWTPGRVTNVILERKPLSLDDAAAIVALAQRHGVKSFTWDWLVYGAPVKVTRVTRGGASAPTAGRPSHSGTRTGTDRR